MCGVSSGVEGRGGGGGGGGNFPDKKVGPGMLIGNSDMLYLTPKGYHRLVRDSRF